MYTHAHTLAGRQTDRHTPSHTHTHTHTHSVTSLTHSLSHTQESQSHTHTPSHTHTHSVSHTRLKKTSSSCPLHTTRNKLPLLIEYWKGPALYIDHKLLQHIRDNCSIRVLGFGPCVKCNNKVTHKGDYWGRGWNPPTPK